MDGVTKEDLIVEKLENPPEIANASALYTLRPGHSGLSFQKVELIDCDFERVVGKRVKVYWSGLKKWFCGCIKSFDNQKKLHKVFYDDGKEEDLDLTRECIELEVLGSEGFRLYPNYQKEESSDGGKVSGAMEKIGLLNMANAGLLKTYSRKSKSMKKARLDLNEQEASKAKEVDMAAYTKVDVHLRNPENKVTRDGSKCVPYGDDIGGEKNGRGFSGLISEKTEIFTVDSTFIGEEYLVNDSVAPVKENLEKLPETQGRNADREGMCTEIEGGVRTNQVISLEVKFDNHGGNIGTEQKRECVFGVPNGMNRSTIRVDNSIVGFDCRKLESLVDNVVWPEECNVKKLPEKRKRRADGEMGQVLSSPQKYSPCFKLRPRKMGPSFQRIELNEKDFERIVGKRLKVYWSGSRKWFVGCIRSYDDDKKLHKVLYEDGEMEDLDLKKELFELEVMRDEGFKLCPKSRPSLEDKNMNLGGGEIIKEMEKNGSLDMAYIEQVKENVSITPKQVAEVAIEGTIRLQGGRETEDSMEDISRVLDIDKNNEDHVTSSKNTYWYMYSEFSKEMEKNAGMDEKLVNKGGFRPQGIGTVGKTEELVDVVINVQPVNNEHQVSSTVNTLWHMYM